jgi:hypothetical protein
MVQTASRGGADIMASKKTLNAGNLEALGAARLAELLIEISQGNAIAQRRLRLELAGADSPAELAREIRKRLATIARSRSFVDWQNRKSLADDLEAQRRAITDQVAKRMPSEGLDLMWRFLELAKSVFGRSDVHGPEQIATRGRLNSPPEAGSNRHPRPVNSPPPGW